MSTWNDFADYLSLTFDEQAWADYNCLHGDELIQLFEEEDFNQLKQIWSKQEETWQRRCAGALAAAEHEAAIGVASAMITNGSDSVAICAADSLRCLLSSHKAEISEEVRERIRTLKQSADGLILAMLTETEKRCQVPFWQDR